MMKPLKKLLHHLKKRKKESYLSESYNSGPYYRCIEIRKLKKNNIYKLPASSEWSRGVVYSRAGKTNIKGK